MSFKLIIWRSEHKSPDVLCTSVAGEGLQYEDIQVRVSRVATTSRVPWSDIGVGGARRRRRGGGSSNSKPNWKFSLGFLSLTIVTTLRWKNASNGKRYWSSARSLTCYWLQASKAHKDFSLATPLNPSPMKWMEERGSCLSLDTTYHNSTLMKSPILPVQDFIKSSEVKSGEIDGTFKWGLWDSLTVWVKRGSIEYYCESATAHC